MAKTGRRLHSLVAAILLFDGFSAAPVLLSLLYMVMLESAHAEYVNGSPYRPSSGEANRMPFTSTGKYWFVQIRPYTFTVRFGLKEPQTKPSHGPAYVSNTERICGPSIQTDSVSSKEG